MKKALRSAFTSLCMWTVISASGQQNSNWYLGHHARISFSTGTAIASAGPLEALEGTATISDQGGNLLFYTEGTTVWDRNDNVMPNGFGLLGGASSTQAALIVPKPGSCGMYYVFTTQDHFQNGDLRYSVVDMCLNNGMGDVVVGQKNILLSTPCAEKLTAVPNSAGTGYWILSHALGSSAFLAFSLTSSGVGTLPVISNAGPVHNTNCLIGPLKASHNGLKLACLTTFCNSVQVYDFNAATGVVSNPLNMTSAYSLPNGCYGVEFSPNDNLLYVSTTFYTNWLYQINLLNSTAVQIASLPDGDYEFGALQLAQDGRIYMARKDETFLDVIEHPDIPGTGCGYQSAGFALTTGTTSDIGMPCMIPSSIMNVVPGALTVDLGPDISLCTGSVTLTAPNSCNNSFLWQDGSAAQSYTATAPGTYWVRVTNSCGVGADTVVVSNAGQVQFDLGLDFALCAGDTVFLSAPSGADSVIWQNGSTSASFPVSTGGSYSLQVYAGGCVASDT